MCQSAARGAGHPRQISGGSEMTGGATVTGSGSATHLIVVLGTRRNEGISTMPTNRRRVLWVVERKYEGEWSATCRVEYTRRAAQIRAADGKHYDPKSEFRVRAYVPREEKKR